MPLTSQQKKEITDLLTRKIREKIKHYKRGTISMPFHIRLVGTDRLAIYSFIQSINTSLGQSIFEEVAAITARPNFAEVKTQFKGFNKTISSEAQLVIQDLMDGLTTGSLKPNKADETRRILAVAQTGTMKPQKPPRIDLYVKAHNSAEFYFDLKTVKPNKGDFQKFKRTLLEWVAIRGAVDPKVNVNTLIAFPYNPYEPETYDWWTPSGVFDAANDLKVGRQFWDFLGGSGAYKDILKVFEQVGLTLKSEIDEAFAKFGK